MTTSSEVREILSRYRFRFQDEAELQAGIEKALTKAGVRFEREVRLTDKDRIDFIVEGGLGIEVKIGGGDSALLQQLGRYAQRPEIREILVVAARLHLVGPRSGKLSDKPVHVYLLPKELA